MDELIKDKLEAQKEVKAKEQEEKDVMSQQVLLFSAYTHTPYPKTAKRIYKSKNTLTRLDFVMKTEHVRPVIATGSTCPTDARNGRRSRDGRRLRSATTDGRNAWNASNATIWNATDGRLLRLSKTKTHLYHSGIRLRLLQNCDRYSYGMFPFFSDFIGVWIIISLHFRL